MISISSDKKLNIILPNTNKALAEVIKNASPKELEVITKGKDLKSIIGSLLKESSVNSSNDKTLLNLVKNNPTFKELGSANKSMQELLTVLKSDKNLLHVEKSLQKFLPNIKELNNTDIKSNIKNSGVFLESKLKDIQNPQIRVKNLLSDLVKLLQKSELNNSKVITKQIKELLSSSILKEASNNSLIMPSKESKNAIVNLSNSISNIVDKLNSEFKMADPITTKNFEAKLTKLEHLLDPKNLENQNYRLNTLLDALKQVTDTMQTSFTRESKGFLDALNKIVRTLESIEQSSIKEVTKNLQNIVDQLKVNIKGADATVVKELSSKIDKIEDTIKNYMSQKTDIRLSSLQDSIRELSVVLKNTQTRDTINVLDSLNKLINTQQSIDKKTVLEIKANIEGIKTFINNHDHIFSKQTKLILDELSLLKAPNKLTVDSSVKEIILNDLKAVLLKAGDEITKLPVSNQSEVLKHIDKLSMQIDYHQLLSHLSDSSSLYIPYSWDEMEDGNITIKHVREDKFYCDIDLKLKEYGELNLRLTIYEKNKLNIHISSDSKEFKNIIKENISILRKALIDTNITPMEIRFLDKSKSKHTSYDNNIDNLDIGFEIKA